MLTYSQVAEKGVRRARAAESWHEGKQGHLGFYFKHLEPIRTVNILLDFLAFDRLVGRVVPPGRNVASRAMSLTRGRDVKPRFSVERGARIIKARLRI